MATDLHEFSRTLFAAADQLWTNSALRPDQYAQPVLALIALRQMETQVRGGPRWRDCAGVRAAGEGGRGSRRLIGLASGHIASLTASRIAGN